MMKTKWAFKVLLAASIGCVGSGASFAADSLDQQQFEERFSGAVSELNAKFEAGYAKFDFEQPPFSSGPSGADGHFVQGAVSAPISDNFGVQIDGGFMDLDFNFSGPFPPTDVGLEATGVGGHLFWRDATVGMLGVYGHSVDYDFTGPFSGGASIKNVRLGVEAEAYFDRISFKGFIGSDNAEFVNFFGPFSVDEDFLAGNAEIGFYMTDNFVLKAGFDHSFESTSATVGFEALADMGGVSPTLFANASFNGGETAIMGGVRVYLGSSSKSLKQRHREDDPDIGLFDNFGAVGSCLNESDGKPRIGNAQASQGLLLFSNPLPPTLNGCQLEGFNPA